ncbi:HD-GYP domain-containing protein [Fodinibius halophilus]|uniref:HD domain-containing protein n=1 Tax=Fodinibius halophilus TaxID=1736908 RepID=A0A6M1T1L7_9BACT|nr:HD domain-containing phosphohydrolase [Fodinibius halophilus]NGP87897.1 HD domain-containing protein [Fodinibius halophilus]
MKDVKSYVQTIAKRLGSAFSLEDFELEDELEFWALAAEYLSRSDSPKFHETAEWMDILYNAPVHFVYLKDEKGKLKLQHRSVLTENLESKFSLSKLNSTERSEKVAQFERRLDNLEKRVVISEEMKEMGGASFPIGHCHRIPLFNEDEFCGMYCTGPYVENPSGIIPRLSIIGRILSKWLTECDKQDAKTETTGRGLEEELSSLESEGLEITGYANVLLGHLTGVKGAESAALVDLSEPKVVAKANMADNFVANIQYFDGDKESVEDLTDYLEDQLDLHDGEDQLVIEPLNTLSPSVFLVLTLKGEQKETFKSSVNYDVIIETLLQLLRYQDQNKHITSRITETYYQMLREIEQKRDKTAHHTDRVMALCNAFGDYFGMGEEEKENILMTAKLHDIGYLSLRQNAKKRTVGSDLEHPVLGYKLVRHLSLNENIKQGISTHHEWVDGSGTPNGIEGDEIVWTGKVVGLFEFIAQFIESNKGNDSKTGEDWLDELTSMLIERADIQFDMILIPTAVEMLNDFSWNDLCELGEGT